MSKMNQSLKFYCCFKLSLWTSSSTSLNAYSSFVLRKNGGSTELKNQLRITINRRGLELVKSFCWRRNLCERYYKTKNFLSFIHVDKMSVISILRNCLFYLFVTEFLYNHDFYHTTVQYSYSRSKTFIVFIFREYILI